MPRSRLLIALAAAAGLVTAPLVVSGPAQAASTTYSVDCSRHSDGVGSSSAPWRSLAQVNAHGAFLPGERILLRRGTTCTGRLHPAGSGTSGSPIVLGAYGKGAKPTLAGHGTADKTSVIQLVNQSWWTIQDLAVTNSTGKRSTLQYRSGVRLVNTGATPMTGLTVQRLTVTKVTSTMRFNTADAREWGGIVAASYGSSNFSGLHILANRVDHVGRTGIMVANHSRVRDRGVVVSGNTVTWTRGDGIVVRGSVGARISRNRVGHAADEWPCAECGGISPLTANAGIWTATSTGNVIEHNEAYGTKVLGGDGEGFDVDASAVNTVVQYNYSHDNEGGGILFCGSRSTVARFNILEDNKKSAIAFIGSMPATDTKIYNNTIYQSRASGAGTVRYFNGAKGKGIRFYNNVVYNFARGTYSWPTSVWSRSNTYVGVHRTGEPRGAGWSWRTPGLIKPGSGGTGITSVRGYRLRSASSAGRGIAIPKSVKVDFFGKRIDPKHPPRGAAG